jgi:hypothetical protein
LCSVSFVSLSLYLYLSISLLFYLILISSSTTSPTRNTLCIMVSGSDQKLHLFRPDRVSGLFAESSVTDLLPVLPPFRSMPLSLDMLQTKNNHYVMAVGGQQGDLSLCISGQRGCFKLCNRPSGVLA